MLVDTQRRNVKRLLWTLALGLLLGALLTLLTVSFLPDSPARDFLTLSVDGRVGPLSVDLAVFAFTIGPVILSVNVLTLVGIAIVAFIVRSWI